MPKQIALLWLSLFFYSTCFSQNAEILGHISFGNQRLAGASIQLKTFKEQKLLFYGFSNDSGDFKLTGPLEQSDKFILIASHIGYKRDTAFITRVDLLKQPIFNWNFSLVEDAKQLDEVYIKAPLAITVNDDTTRYNVQKFTSLEDRNLESVIKKMPGMEVNKDGIIFFKGKKINKVLLEGDDLAGGNYKAITKNITPNIIEEIQAIDHYIEDNLLKGIINSDDVVLNLKIKNKKAKKILGSADVAVGTNERRMLVTNLVSFIDQTKAFAFLNHDNLSNQSNNLLVPVDEVDREFKVDNRIIKHYIDAYNPFDDALFTINKSTNGSVSSITRINDKFKMNCSLFYFRNKLCAQAFLRNNFFSPYLISTEDNETRTSLSRTFKADFGADYLIKKNARLLTKLTYQQEPKRFASTAFSIYDNITGDSVLQSQSDLNKKIVGELKYTVKANKNTAYLFSGKILTDNVDQDYKTSSQLYQSISVFQGAQSLRQVIVNQNLKLKFDFEGLKRYKTSFLYFNIGNEFDHFQLNSNLFGINQNNEILIGKEFVNQGLFKINKSYIIGKYVFDNRLIKIQAQLKPILQCLKNMNRDSSYLILEPSLSLSYKLSQIQNLSFRYNYRNVNPKPIEYYEHYILTNLRSFNSGLISFYNFNTHQIGINYNFNDFSTSYFSFNASANGSYSKRGFLYTNLFIDRLNYMKKEPFRGAKSLDMNFNIKKFFPIFSLSLTVNYAPSFSTYYSKIGPDFEKLTSLNQSVMFKINTGFNLPINFSIGSELQTNRVSSENGIIVKNIPKNYRLEYRYKITSKIFNVSSLDVYKMNGNKFNFIDAEFQYIPAKGIFQYSLQGKNLGNVKEFSTLNIGETYFSSYSSTILGRYVLFNISMSIK